MKDSTSVEIVEDDEMMGDGCWRSVHGQADTRQNDYITSTNKIKGNTMKTISTSIALIMAAALLASAPVGVQAAETPAKGEVKSHHEGPPPAAGEIVKLTADSIEIKDHKGTTDTFIITADTKYGTKEKPAKPEDFKEGEHVLVSYTKAGGKMTATVIRELPPHHHHG